MNIEDLISQTLTDHEDVAIDEAAVLDGIRHRISHRRPLGRAVTVTASVTAAAVVATVGIGLTAIHRLPDTRAAQPGSAPTSAVQSPARTSPPKVALSAGPTSTAPRRPGTTMPFDLGWLPSGSRHFLAIRINHARDAAGTPYLDGEYLLDVTTPTAVLMVDVQQMPGTVASDAGFKCGAGRTTTVDGRPGVEDLDAAGGTMYINVAPEPGSSASAADLATIGRHVAATLSFPGTTPVQPS